MSESLRDQLLKAGLVDEKKLRQSRQGRKKVGRPGTGAADPIPGVGANRDRQAERSRELNRQRQEAAQRKAVAAQIRQIIREHRLARDEADQTYHFQHGERIRSMHVTGDQRDGLVRGQLGIVTLADRYELVPREAVEKIRTRDADRVIVCNEPDAERADGKDDPYAGYEIPDDITW